MSRILFFIAVLLLALCSCVVEPAYDAGGVTISFHPSIQDTQGDTRVTGNRWNSGDQVGIYMFSDDNPPETLSSNVRYDISLESGLARLLPTSQTLLFPAGRKEVRFAGYYPYRPGLEQGNNYKVQVGTVEGHEQVLPEVDLVYSRPVNKYTSASSTVPLTFHHQLSKLIIHIESLNDLDISEMEVYLEGFPTQADFNLLSGELSDIKKSDNEARITLHKMKSDPGKAGFEAILVPHAAAAFSPRTIYFKLDGSQPYAFELTQESKYSFETGIAYTYNFTIDTSVTLVENTIVDWMDGTIAWNGGQLSVNRSSFNLGNISSNQAVLISTFSVDSDISVANINAYATPPNEGNPVPVDWINNFRVEKEESQSQSPIKNYTLRFSISENTGETDRTGYIHVHVGGIVLVITINQYATYVSSPVPRSFVVDAGPEQEYSFTFETTHPGLLTHKQVKPLPDPTFIKVEDISVSVSEIGSMYRWTVSFRVPENTGDTPRTNSIEMGVQKGIGAEGDIVPFGFETTVTQMPGIPFGNGAGESGNVSAETNCYIIQPGATLRIPVDRALAQNAVPTHADVPWRDPWNTISVWPQYNREGNHITLTAGEAAGNALVTLVGSNGVLWSWHIWVTRYNPDAPGISWEAPNGLEFMDRNLGAISGSMGSQVIRDTYGLYYQWGRKDPFHTTGQSVNTINGQQTSDYAQRNPDRFIVTGNQNHDNWMIGNDPGRWDNNGKKTIHDPCPYGWRVPSVSANGESPWHGLNGTNGSYVEGKGYFWKNQTGNIIFYPSAGYRNDWDAQVSESGTHGSYWTATAHTDNDNAYDLSFTSQSLNNVGAWYRSMGYSVRCVRE